jgi:hypothetical protein
MTWFDIAYASTPETRQQGRAARRRFVFVFCSAIALLFAIAFAAETHDGAKMVHVRCDIGGAVVEFTAPQRDVWINQQKGFLRWRDAEGTHQVGLPLSGYACTKERAQ